MSKESVTYFTFKGNRYKYGTIVKFAPKDYRKSTYQYAMYDGVDSTFVYLDGPNGKETGWYTMVNNEDEIEEIIKPVIWKKEEWVKTSKDTESEDMFYAWIIYIAVMLFMFIFNDRIIGWIAATIVFYYYRHSKLYTKKAVYEREQKLIHGKLK